MLEQAITIKGYGNRSRGNTFINVGNNGGTTATHSIIKFLTPGNSSYQDYFERTNQLTTTNLSLDYIPEIEGPAYREEVFTNVISLPNTLVPIEIIRLPISDSTSLEVNYLFTSSTFQQVRKGTIHLVVDKLTDGLQLVDDYEYSGPNLGEDAIIFTAEVKVPNGGSTVKSVVISYINQNVTVDTNSFTYTFTITS